MTATLLDGKACAAVVKADLAARVVKLGAAGITPGLGTVLVLSLIHISEPTRLL